MFCKNCGTLLPHGSDYCPNCGTRNTMRTLASDRINSSKPVTRNRAMMIAVGILLMGLLVMAIWFKSPPATGEVILQETASAISTSIEDTSESEDAIQSQSVVGVWKGEKGEVTFTENGHMMLGKNGIALGGGWLQYEVVDHNTLYLSGGDMPVGINMGYELDGDYLGLELNGETIIFMKEQ